MNTMEDTPYTRLVAEKRALDERIIKLKDFLDTARNEHGELDYPLLAPKVGSPEAAYLLEEQLDLELSLSNVLNKRILLWKD